MKFSCVGIALLLFSFLNGLGAWASQENLDSGLLDGKGTIGIVCRNGSDEISLIHPISEKGPTPADTLKAIGEAFKEVQDDMPFGLYGASDCGLEGLTQEKLDKASVIVYPSEQPKTPEQQQP